VAKCHAIGGQGWEGVFHSMFTAWGVMMLKHGHFHTDPHPGNFMVANDGKLILLDWGQTKRVGDYERMHMCRLSLYMAHEDHVSIAREILEHGSVRLERPTTEALSALSYAYFDTRPSSLAEMNVMDFKNSPFVQNKILQNTQEGFFAIRSVFLLRGMLSTCGLQMSMVEAWRTIARQAMIAHGEIPPSRLRLKTQMVINRSLIAVQRRLNIGHGAKINVVEDYMSNSRRDDASLWPSSSSLF
jgi:aarF domain-containing kinase